MKITSFYLTDLLISKLKEQAARERRSVSNLVQVLLEDSLSRSA